MAGKTTPNQQAVLTVSHRHFVYRSQAKFETEGRKVPSRGKLVAVFILDLSLARPQNATRHALGWQLHADRKALLDVMALQWNQQRHDFEGVLPLEGRPQVNVVRFSSRAPDPYSNFGKEAIDCIQPARVRRWKGRVLRVPGLGLIANDSPTDIEEHQWHHPIKRGDLGYVYLEVRSDAL